MTQSEEPTVLEPGEVEILEQHADGRVVFRRISDGEIFEGTIVGSGLTRDQAEAMVEAGHQTHH